mgnify:CR=1 FL=1
MKENKVADSSKRVGGYIRKGDEIIDTTYDGVSKPPYKAYSALDALEGDLSVSNDNENFIVRYYSKSKRTGVVFVEFLKDHSLKCISIGAFYMGMTYSRRNIHKAYIGEKFNLAGLGNCTLVDTCKDNIHVMLENNERGYKVKLRDILDGRIPYHIWKEAENNGYFYDMNENRVLKGVVHEEILDGKNELDFLKLHIKEKDNKIKSLEAVVKSLREMVTIKENIEEILSDGYVGKRDKKLKELEEVIMLKDKRIFDLKSQLNESGKNIGILKDTIKRKDEELTSLRGLIAGDLLKAITNGVEVRFTDCRSDKSNEDKVELSDVERCTENNCVNEDDDKNCIQTSTNKQQSKVMKKYTKSEFKNKVVCGRKCKENEFLDLTYTNLKKPEFNSTNCYEALRGKLCKSIDGELYKVRYTSGNCKGFVYVEFLKDHSMRCINRQVFPRGISYGSWHRIKTHIGASFQLVGFEGEFTITDAEDNGYATLSNKAGVTFKVSIRDLLDNRTPYNVWHKAKENGFFDGFVKIGESELN